MSGIAEKLRSRMQRDIEHKVIKIGWLESAVYENGTPVGEVAAIQEFGTATIPARPFIRPTIEEKKSEWSKNIQDGVREVMRGAMTADAMLQIVGNGAAGDIKKTISELTSPELEESTILARVRRTASGDRTDSIEKPLVDTGTMLATLTSVVEDK